MNKREFLKSSILSIGAAFIMPTFSFSIRAQEEKKRQLIFFEQPPLGFPYDALEPFIDARTMEIHYSKHHATYTKNLNDQLSRLSHVPRSIIEIFESITKFPVSVRNNGGGYFNHNLFWKIITPGGQKEPKNELRVAIEKNFGSYEEFKKVFTDQAMSVFGSGWAWLIDTKDGLKIITTANQDNPFMETEKVKGYPILMIDVWEHAYYLKYQNRRKEYIEAFWNVVNWDQVYAFFVNRTYF